MGLQDSDPDTASVIIDILQRFAVKWGWKFNHAQLLMFGEGAVTILTRGNQKLEFQIDCDVLTAVLKQIDAVITVPAQSVDIITTPTWIYIPSTTIPAPQYIAGIDWAMHEPEIDRTMLFVGDPKFLRKFRAFAKVPRPDRYPQKTVNPAPADPTIDITWESTPDSAHVTWATQLSIPEQILDPYSSHS